MESGPGSEKFVLAERARGLQKSEDMRDSATRLRGGNAGAVAAAGPPNLGLVCITANERYRFRSTTFKRVSGLSETEGEKLLTGIYWENVQRLHAMLGYLDRNSIRLYRISSAIFPMSDLGVGERALSSMRNLMSSVGRRAVALGIRMVIHPDQFVVLNSPSEKVRATSRLILEKHGRNMDWLGLPRSEWAAMNIHGGYAGLGVEAKTAEKAARPRQKLARDAAAAAKTSKLVELKAAQGARKRDLMDVLCREVETLPAEVRSRLTFENDEHGYSAGDILEVCRRVGTPMVFDNLHHSIHEGLDDFNAPSFEECVRAARETWSTPAWQLVHLSNGAAGPGDRFHSEYISQLPESYRNGAVQWIEVEARGKERAIFHLRETWRLSDSARLKTVPNEASGTVGFGGEE